MEKITFTVKELCAIMKAGNSCGVASLKLGELQIVYAPKAVPPVLPEQETYYRPISEGEKSEIQDSLEKDADEQEIRYREEQIAFSLIEDPELAEKLLADGDLEDDDNVGQDDD